MQDEFQLLSLDLDESNHNQKTMISTRVEVTQIAYMHILVLIDLSIEKCKLKLIFVNIVS